MTLADAKPVATRHCRIRLKTPKASSHDPWDRPSPRFFEKLAGLPFATCQALLPDFYFSLSFVPAKVLRFMITWFPVQALMHYSFDTLKITAPTRPQRISALRHGIQETAFPAHRWPSSEGNSSFTWACRVTPEQYFWEASCMIDWHGRQWKYWTREWVGTWCAKRYDFAPAFSRTPSRVQKNVSGVVCSQRNFRNMEKTCPFRLKYCAFSQTLFLQTEQGPLEGDNKLNQKRLSRSVLG